MSSLRMSAHSGWAFLAAGITAVAVSMAMALPAAATQRAAESGQGVTIGGAIVPLVGSSSEPLTPPEGDDYVAIAAGNVFSLALRTDGSIVGWGDGSTPPGTDFVAISAGYFHGVALRRNGSLVHWNMPGTPPAGTNFVAVDAGGNFSMALRNDGSIIGWDNNVAWQDSPPPGQVYVAISAGAAHTLALLSDGSIVGKGDNTYGQATPPAGNDFVAISAGLNQSMALRRDGSVVQWGGAFFQVPPPAGNDFVAVSAGGNFSMALRRDGSVFSWAGTVWSDETPPPGHLYVAIAAGWDHGLAISAAQTGTSPSFTSAGSATFTVGTAESFTVTTTGLPVATLSESGALPTGVTFNAATGVLSGTPADGTAGNWPITFTADNGVGTPAAQNFILAVVAAPAQPPPAGSPPVSSPPVAAPPAPPPGPSASVRVKATRRDSQLYVDINPNKGKGYWRFQVQRKQANGSWKPLKTYKTKGTKETRTVNLKRGTYRVFVNPKYGCLGTTSAEVYLKK